MHIKLANNVTYDIKDLKVDNGTLYIQFENKTAEEVQSIISKPENLGRIILLDDNDADLAYYDNFTILAGVLLSPESLTTGMLTQQQDSTAVRIEGLETKLSQALSTIENLNSTVNTLTEELETMKAQAAQA